MGGLTPKPIGSRITTYQVRGTWPDGERIDESHDDESEALEAARNCESNGAVDVAVDLRVELVIAEVESVETIYGSEEAS